MYIKKLEDIIENNEYGLNFIFKTNNIPVATLKFETVEELREFLDEKNKEWYIELYADYIRQDISFIHKLATEYDKAYFNPKFHEEHAFDDPINFITNKELLW